MFLYLACFGPAINGSEWNGPDPQFSSIRCSVARISPRFPSLLLFCFLNMERISWWCSYGTLLLLCPQLPSFRPFRLYSTCYLSTVHLLPRHISRWVYVFGIVSLFAVPESPSFPFSIPTPPRWSSRTIVTMSYEHSRIQSLDLSLTSSGGCQSFASNFRSVQLILLAVRRFRRHTCDFETTARSGW